VRRGGTSSHAQYQKPARRTLVIPEHLARRVALDIIRDLEFDQDDDDA